MVDGLIKVESKYDFGTTLEKAIAAIRKRNITVFSVIDHRKNATDAGLELGNETLIIFGNAQAGTKLMQDKPSIGIDLPLKLLVSEEDGKTVLRYYNPLHLGKVHQLDKNLDVINNISGMLGSIVDEAARK
ncbi:MAG: DUF302 domain-containing protein [Candidatus Marsarchaeota archaeon]|jgi:uncharacterized protein (DUF302 family)|nr:DUF302 domain-containing protein [Candidatus Marsarchaeota archaeon]